MTGAQVITHAITHAAVEAEKAAQIREVVGTEGGTKQKSVTKSAGSKLGEASLTLPSFDWSATDKYKVLRNF